MNWFDYLQGYEQGQQDGRLNHHKRPGVMPGLLNLLSVFLLFVFTLFFSLLEGLYLLLHAIYRLCALVIKRK